MNRDQFREQITQRYVAGKALDGASLAEISAGKVDPVEQMNYVTGQSKQKTRIEAPSSGESGTAWLLFILLLAAAVISLLFKFFL